MKNIDNASYLYDFFVFKAFINPIILLFIC